MAENQRNNFDYALEVLRLWWGDPRYRIPRLLILAGLPLVAAPWWQPVAYGLVSRWLDIDSETLAVSAWAIFGSGWVLILLGVGLYIRVARQPTVSADKPLPPPTPVAPPPQQITVKLEHPTAGPTRAIPPPHELPPKAHEFCGRETELANLTKRLSAGNDAAVVGPAGLGKTALAAKALLAVVGDTPETLAASPFPDGVVFLDLYTFHGEAEPAWGAVANKLAGPDFMERSPARERAAEACRGRRILVVIEGGEEADGNDGRADINEILSVLSPRNKRLLLTRQSTQTVPVETVKLDHALQRADAARLLDALTQQQLQADVREHVLKLLEGHPLALTWAGNLLHRGDESPERLSADWEHESLPSLSDPKQAQHTLKWLFDRSVRGLDDPARQALEASGLLARAPFPLAAIDAALGGPGGGNERGARDALRSLVQRGLLRLADTADHWEFTHVLGYRFARKESGSDPALRKHLGRWLHAHLKASLTLTQTSKPSRDRQGAVPHSAKPASPTAPLTGALDHLGALLRADDDQRLWRPLAYSALYDIRDRLTDLGRLGQVTLALDAVAGWMERFPADKAQESDWARERSVLWNRQADVLLEQGDLKGALGAYGEAEAVSRRLAEADPSNARWQHDLSVSTEKIGDVLLQQGDLKGALGAYREGEAVIRRLAEADPSHAGWQRDLSVSQNKIGDVLLEQGDLQGALGAYREAEAVSRRLAEADPSNARWQHDLSVSQIKIGNVLLAQGDLKRALGAYREAEALMRRLAEVDPSNATWQRDLSVSLIRIALVKERQGDVAGALPHAEEALTITERLAVLDPTNATWQNDVEFTRALVARLRG